MKQPWTDWILRGRDKPRGALDDNKTRPALPAASLEQGYRELLLENQVLQEANQRLQAQVIEVKNKHATVDSIERQLIRDQRKTIAERSHELRQQQYACKTLQRERDRLRENNRRLAEKTARMSAAMASMKQQLATAQTLNESLQREIAEKSHDLVTLSERHYQLQAKLDPTMSTRRVVNVDF